MNTMFIGSLCDGNAIIFDTLQNLLSDLGSDAAGCTHNLGGETRQECVQDMGYLPSRVYTIFMLHHRMKIFANHDVDAIYDQKYQERRDRGEHPSILELVHEDLGMEAKDPIRRLIKLYPRETDRMRSFYKEVESMVRSMYAR